MLPSHTFYPIKWKEWKKYFDTRKIENFNLLNDTEALQKSAIAIHIWNKLSSEEKAQKSLRGRQLFTQLAHSQCQVNYHKVSLCIIVFIIV